MRGQCIQLICWMRHTQDRLDRTCRDVKRNGANCNQQLQYSRFLAGSAVKADNSQRRLGRASLHFVVRLFIGCLIMRPVPVKATRFAASKSTSAVYQRCGFDRAPPFLRPFGYKVSRRCVTAVAVMFNVQMLQLCSTSRCCSYVERPDVAVMFNVQMSQLCSTSRCCKQVRLALEETHAGHRV